MVKRPFRWWLASLVFACSCSTNTAANNSDVRPLEAGVDGISRDSVVPDTSAVDSEVPVALPLPVYRMGPRGASTGFFGPTTYSGTVRLPL